MTREEELLRAKRVRELIENADTLQAVEDIKADLLADLVRTAWDETRYREAIYTEIRALDRLMSRLRTWVEELHK